MFYFRFILQLAYERNAAVVSNDNYRDLIHENPAFKKIIENRVIGYSWCDDILILPKDPYGRFGPPLDEILRCKSYKFSSFEFHFHFFSFWFRV